ncbi:hypothetical protein [Megasphaera sp.]|uniref:hypothetical protein n=1 Tax=Megasphaera sp. TaxID=2023260 RepID=UPI00351FBEDD
MPKFGKKFDAISLLHDHACHTGKPYVNGHCFVSLTLSIPVLSQHKGKAPHIRYLAVPVGYPDVDERKAQTAKNSTDLVQALCKLASSISEAA